MKSLISKLIITLVLFQITSTASYATVFTINIQQPIIEEITIRNDKPVTFDPVTFTLNKCKATEADITCNNYCKSIGFQGGVATEPEASYSYTIGGNCYCTLDQEILGTQNKTVIKSATLTVTVGQDNNLVAGGGKLSNSGSCLSVKSADPNNKIPKETLMEIASQVLNALIIGGVYK